ncbi:glycosyltransferase family 31 protein [Stipitochalara longipes BDJ]|nr:glycosyltransferase family 31 protein [Stipitochalara longipes BDJ]
MGSPIAGGPMLNPRSSLSWVVLLTLFGLVLFFYTFRSTTTANRVEPFETEEIYVQNGNQTHVLDCTLNATHLQSLQWRYKLQDNIQYGRRYIRFHRENIARASITRIDNDLFPRGFDTINVNKPPPTTACPKPLDVAVPRSPYPSTVDASDLLFGISTKFERLSDPKTGPIIEWSHWLTNGNGKTNGAGLILRLVDATNAEIEATRQMMQEMGMDVKVFPSNSSIEMAKRYLSLLPALYQESQHKKRKFLVMCDDDTFFPSMHRLVERLSTYDHTTDLYMGTFSEDVNNIERHGSQAFGGAGVFFSVSLAKKVSSFFPQCSTAKKIEESNTGWGPQGDILLRKCIYENTEVRLTLLRDLHQLDIMGDPAGFYESGIAPLSLHHFKGGIWHEAHPYEGVQISHACGEDCFLQRFQTKDNYIISNGFSVAHYPKGIDFNVHQMERTFGAAPDDYGWNLDFMLGPGRKSLLTTGRKAAWELKESRVEENGSVRQTYIRKGDDRRWTFEMGGQGWKMFDKDGVLELIWIS